MAISLRQTRLYLLKTLRVYNWLAGALAIIFLLFALYRAYLAMEAGESFSSFYDGLFTPFWHWFWSVVFYLPVLLVIILTLTKKRD